MTKAVGFSNEGKSLDFLNSTGSDIAYRDIIISGNKVFIAGENIANGSTGTIHDYGVWELPSVNDAAFAIGDRLYWDASAGKITKVVTGGIYMGYAAEAKAETATTGLVKLSQETNQPSEFVKGSRFQVTYPQVAAADVAKTFFVAPATCKIVSARERHVTVAGQAGVLTIEKLTSGEAPGSGDDLFTTGFDLTSTANTPVTKTAVTTAAGTLAAGDALCLKVQSGAATSYALGTITVTMEWL